MQFVVLGSGTSVFHPRRAAAGFWLQTETGSMLLDCGSDTPHRMAAENLDWINLDAIWISHLHLDHCGGLAPFLFGMRHAPGIEQRTKPLKIFACEGVRKFLQAIDESHNYQLFQQRFPIEIQEFSASEEKAFEMIPGLKAETFSTPHRRESLAIRLTSSNGKTVVYTSDTGYSDEVAQFSRGADLLILECSFYRDKPIATHLKLAEAMRIARVAEPRTLVLTHLYPEWDAVDLEAEAKKLWSGETIAARDGLRWKFEGTWAGKTESKKTNYPMRRSFLIALFASTLLFSLSCERQIARTRQPLRPPEQQTEIRALAANSSPELKAIIDGAADQVGKTTGYDPSYQKIDYPNGDVPIETGVCSDVIVRAFRKGGIDLQKEVHEDMKSNFAAYPTKWGLNGPDANIDHRRVPNLQTFFARKGKSQTISNTAVDFHPGDIVTWDLGGGTDHVGMVTNVWYKPSQRYLIVHNIGGGTRMEDVLFSWKITGHYRYF